MKPKVIGNPLVAWRADDVLQIGWGRHAVVIEGAPAELPRWLALVTGARALDRLLVAAEAHGIPSDEATSLLDQLERVGLVQYSRSPSRVRLEPCGAIREPLERALTDAGLTVDPQADVVVYVQGQLPSLLDAPPLRHRLVPLWFSATAVHVGPVLDDAAGPCPSCIDRVWAGVDQAWADLVAQATTVGSWHTPAQLTQAAAGIALIADDPATVGLEMIFDPAQAGPAWRVWTADPGCACQTGAIPSAAGVETRG
jgi:hypothetical protein